ncbi:Uncharacterised protein [Yersinia frederiksenii]|uniref:Zinc ribbon domain-containing protein n=2 Tax=Yersinia frederiksenii TaxID=29484 RepID=A0A380PPS3_YERFR|nr:zinc ribbon domain-containing protein [Yersinia frederiksenii]ATM95782.1 zinc ribbon domain-containing protein [Yersinia frederiksenii]KGA44313.1 hypothetical protein DJ58_3156 [Yersinia frederiksenii ATCC 33641]SUP75570.1 Uncharacterised protein [Yersinia frederiksenii]
MALKNCRECNAQVSSEARVCPHCGIKKPYQSRVKSIILILIIAFVGYVKFSSEGHDSSTSKESATTFHSPKVNEPANEVKPFTLYQVCRAGIATVMGREIKTIKASASPSSEIVLLTYTRPDDRKVFSYQCKLSGNFIIWSEAGVSTNRWEGNGEIDSLLTYTVNTQDETTKKKSRSELVIEEKYPDGDQTSKSFLLSEFYTLGK